LRRKAPRRVALAATGNDDVMTTGILAIWRMLFRGRGDKPQTGARGPE